MVCGRDFAMELSIIDRGETVGTASMESDGIYWKLVCRLTQKKNSPIRLYGLHLWQSEYLGIPDADGLLQTKIPKKHLPHGADMILASEQPNGKWKPWAGQIDGVRVEAGLLQKDGGILLALEPEEAVRFPEWIEIMEKVQMPDSERLLLRLDEEGNLREIEKKLGGTNNETMDRDAPAVELPADDSSDDDYYDISDFDAAEQGRQTDSADI